MTWGKLARAGQRATLPEPMDAPRGRLGYLPRTIVQYSPVIPRMLFEE